MTILVTGGCGFIGSHLVERLVSLGEKVIVIDDMSSNVVDGFDGDVTIIKSDLVLQAFRNEIVEDISICIHLAAKSLVQESITSPYTSVDNVKGIRTVLQVAGSYKIPVVYASSSAVYGSWYLPFKEHDEPRPISPYGVDKLACEHYARAIGRYYGIGTIGLRLFNVYGKRDRNHVIPMFEDKMKKNDDVEVFGNCYRDYVHIDDVVDAFICAMNTAKLRKHIAGIYNICTCVSTRTFALAHTMKTLLQSKSVIIKHSARKLDAQHVVGDFTRARTTLRWNPKTALPDGLHKTLLEA